jgi:hypothetical protein
MLQQRSFPTLKNRDRYSTDAFALGCCFNKAQNTFLLWPDPGLWISKSVWLDAECAAETKLKAETKRSRTMSQKTHNLITEENSRNGCDPGLKRTNESNLVRKIDSTGIGRLQFGRRETIMDAGEDENRRK